MLVIDSKGFPETKEFPAGMSFSICRKKGQKYIHDNSLVYALDIAAAREKGIVPMPFGKGLQFDKAAGLALYRARRIAEDLHSESLGARHLLLGLLSLKNGLVEQMLESLQEGSAEQVREIARKSLTPETPHCGPLREDENWKEIMRKLEQKAKNEKLFLVDEFLLAETLLGTPSQVEGVLEEASLTHNSLTPNKCLAKLRELRRDKPLPSMWYNSSGFAE
ncbi:MAG: hypothetical protein D6732_17545 [Methanobacteriota archaeon]|nr:MAG: hypothetical protein D6732_17545 [Euryarchaeota archaeon]